MKKEFWGVLGALVLTAGVSSPALATTASSFSSFEGEEEPTDRVYSSGSVTKGDTYDNMTSPASGTFKFYLRFSSSVWDGDRDTSSTDRQRAEVKGLGSRQGTSDTFDYDHTWKTSRGGSGSFWHVFQLKGVDGDNGSPLVVNSILSSSSAALRYCSNGQSGFTVARSYSFTVGSFMRSTIRIKPSTGTGGIVQLGINGGSLSGKSGIALYRSGSTQYRPKWGSYRGVSSSSPYGNDTVEQKGVMATKR